MGNLNEDTYRKLKKEVDFAKEEATRAEGALDQLTNRLINEFECDDLEAAKKKLKNLEKEATKAEEAFEEALTDYQKKWKGD